MSTAERPLAELEPGDEVTFIDGESREIVATDPKFIYFRDATFGEKPIDRHMLQHAIDDGIATVEGGADQ